MAASSKAGLLDLEHRVLAQIKDCLEVSSKGAPPLLLAVSGGLDSIVLLEVLSRLKIVSSLALAHVHHGPSDDIFLRDFRNRAQDFVLQQAEGLGLRVFTNPQNGSLPLGARPQSTELKSEADLREFRYQWLRYWAAQEGRILVLAQHRDDLLETRLTRLVRGTGLTGLPAMQAFKDNLFRPLLGVSRSDLEVYGGTRGLNWIEDPSNQDRSRLRNWMRHEWLPQLEEYRPGGVDVLARSLEQLSQELDVAQRLDWLYGLALGEKGVRRWVLATLPKEARAIVLVEYFRRRGLASFTSAQIRELLKILDSKQKNFSFSFLACQWKVDPDWINARSSE